MVELVNPTFDPIYTAVAAHFKAFPYEDQESKGARLTEMSEGEIPELASADDALAFYEAIGRLLGSDVNTREIRVADPAAPHQASLKLSERVTPRATLRSFTITHALVDPERAPDWRLTWRRFDARRLISNRLRFDSLSNKYNPHPLEIEKNKGKEQYDERPLKAEATAIFDLLGLFETQS